MTTTQLQLRRDTTANIDAITPAQGEPLYDVTRHALVLGDGATVGGDCVTPFAGSWTPQLQFGGANAGMTTSEADGLWVQIGPIVICFFRIVLTALGSSTGNATIAGLPVAVTNAGPAFGGGGPCVSGGTVSVSGGIQAEAVINTTTVALLTNASTGTTPLTNANFANSSAINGMIVYQATQPTA
jgi:hypothetical protein